MIQILKFHFWLVDNHQSFLPNSFLYRTSQIFLDIFAKNMNGWSDKSKILCIEQSDHAEKTKIFPVQPFLVQIFPKYFSLTWISEDICCCFSKSLFNWSPHFITSFSKAVKIQTDSCTAEMGFQLVPKYLKESETAKICSPKYFYLK